MARGLVAFAVLSFAACTPTHHTIEPYRSDPEAARAIEAEADRACPRSPDKRPPHHFTTDGCSAFPDRGWVRCCIEHDFEYWCGGTSEDRSRADARLRECVTEKQSAALGWVMWAGVRAGGVPWMPAPWRWAYGWDWYRGYDPRD